MVYLDNSGDHLAHYGVIGMKWGVRKDRERAGDGRRSTTSGKSKVEKKKGLSDSQKRALKIGAAVAVTALAAYGGYKLYQNGQLQSGIVDAGKSVVKDILPKSDFQKSLADQGVSMMTPESRADSIKKVNPSGGTKNCTACAVSYNLRRLGFNATAKSMPKGKDLLSVVDDCFSGAKSVEGTATTFGKSSQDAKDFLVKKFGDNAKGVVGITWTNQYNSDGSRKQHAFSFEIESGNVIFTDGQQGITREVVDRYWDNSNIYTQGQFKVARLDNATPKLEGIRKYVDL